MEQSVYAREKQKKAIEVSAIVESERGSNVMQNFEYHRRKTVLHTLKI